MIRKTKRRTLLSIFTTVLVLSMGITSFAGMSNFKETTPYPGYSDVKSTSWYYNDVVKSTKLGLFNGYPDGTFLPEENITIAEALKVATVIRATYDGEVSPVVASKGAWYTNFVSYAKDKNIIKEEDFANYNQVAKRNEMAYIFSKALPLNEYEEINKVTELPDVDSSTANHDSIFALYKAGVLRGDDENKTFRPNENVKRVEAAAIFNRVVNKGERIRFAEPEKPASSGGSSSAPPAPAPAKTVATLKSLTYSYTDLGGTVQTAAVSGFSPATTQYAITIYDKDFDATRIDVTPVVTDGSNATITENLGVDLVADTGTAAVVVTAEDATTTNRYEVDFTIDRKTMSIESLSYGKYTAGGAFSDLIISVEGTDQSGAPTTAPLTFGDYYVNINGVALTEGSDFDVTDINLGTIRVYASALNSLSADRYEIEVAVETGGLLMTGSQYLYVIPATSEINYTPDTGDALIYVYEFDTNTDTQGGLITSGDTVPAGEEAFILFADTTASGKTVNRIVITQAYGTTTEVYDSAIDSWMIDNFNSAGYFVWTYYGDVTIFVYAE